MKKLFIGLLTIFLTLVLSGCLYPGNSDTSSSPNEKQIEMVQEAVNNYRSDHDGLLPIKNKDVDTDIYIKYLIDFSKLVPSYLPSPPSTAYEEGGIFQYVLIEPETNPTVKVFDLKIAEKIRDINFRLMTKEYPPFKGTLAPNVYTLDFQKLGYKEDPVVISPYSGNPLPFVINGQGEIFVDYSSDLSEILKENTSREFSPGEDIRFLLTENSPFVPAYSLPYTIDEKGELVFLSKIPISTSK